MEKMKILVVDDESRMRKLIRDFLERENYRILEAGDGIEAMDLFYEHKDIDLVILDVMMPRMDGWEVCKEIRSHSKVPIVMLTARAEETSELKGFELGVDEYISKPFSPKILVAKSKNVCAEYHRKILAKSTFSRCYFGHNTRGTKLRLYSQKVHWETEKY